MIHYLYILQSLKKRTFYIGATADVRKRLDQHNKGQTKSTKPYTPWIVIYTELYESKTEAYKREFYLKKPQGYTEKLEIISQYSLEG